MAGCKPGRGAISILLLTAYISFPAVALDWPCWRGPDHNGVSRETGFAKRFGADGARIAWRAEVGTGFSSIAVADGRACTMGQPHKEHDVVFCFDAETGEGLWEYRYPEPLDPNLYEGGPSATPTIDEGRVYTVSKSGKIHALDAATGKVIWSKAYPVRPPTWGIAGSIYVAGNTLVLNSASFGMALNKEDGRLLWRNGDGPTGYSSPAPFEMDGRRAVALFSEKCLAGVEIETGAILWRIPWTTKYQLNIPDPLIRGNEVFVTSGMESGCSLYRIENGQPTELYHNKNMGNHLNSSIYHNGALFGFDEVTLSCVDWSSGKTLWRQRGLGRGSLMYADGTLIILSEKGEVVFAEASRDAYREIDRADVLKAKCWTVPVLANGRIYARNAAGSLVCVDVRQP